MTRHGVALVFKQEFLVRLRTGRWRWLMAAWVTVIFLFTALFEAGFSTSFSSYHDNSAWVGERWQGIPLFGALMLFVLALAMIISPALTAQSINGDRERGTLATLQVTRLTAGDIAIGKLLAGWAVGAGALALTLPFVGWSILRGGVGVWRAAVVLFVVVLLIGVVCAVSQALSAMLARSITSALLSYVTVAALTLGTVLAFGLALPLSEGNSYGDREDRVWWLLAPNPFVVLADSAPQAPLKRDPRTGRLQPPPVSDPLGEIGREVRQMRFSPAEKRAYYDRYFDGRAEWPTRRVWPYGLAFNLLLGAGSVAVTIRRLRTPVRELTRGTRIA
jgi:ABC-type transport system involved in multi-copper enzyme maturation permease subunit